MFQYTNDMKLTELLSALRLQAPYSSYGTQQEIEYSLNDLAHGHNFRRLKPEFRKLVTGDNAYFRMNNELGDAYREWRMNRDVKATLFHLENVTDICNERLSPEYHAEYTSTVSYFRGMLSR